MNLAIAEKDHATAGMLQWFVSEQVEEEAHVDGIVQKLKMADKAPGAMLMMDHALGERK
jgi:ferritin